MIRTEQQGRNAALLDVAARMMTAARTAPKARGVDNLKLAVVSGEDLERLAQRMEQTGQATGQKFFVRDAANIRQSEALVLFGTCVAALGLNCGYCGFPTCAAKDSSSPLTPCVFNSNDLGIAIGSAASVAADSRVDTRVMFSAGYAARELGMLEGCSYILAMPLSCTGKSPFFDRPAL